MSDFFEIVEWYEESRSADLEKTKIFNRLKSISLTSIGNIVDYGEHSCYIDIRGCHYRGFGHEVLLLSLDGEFKRLIYHALGLRCCEIIRECRERSSDELLSVCDSLSDIGCFVVPRMVSAEQYLLLHDGNSLTRSIDCIRDMLLKLTGLVDMEFFFKRFEIGFLYETVFCDTLLEEGDDIAQKLWSDLSAIVRVLYESGYGDTLVQFDLSVDQCVFYNGEIYLIDPFIFIKSRSDQ